MVHTCSRELIEQSHNTLLLAEVVNRSRFQSRFSNDVPLDVSAKFSIAGTVPSGMVNWHLTSQPCCLTKSIASLIDQMHLRGYHVDAGATSYITGIIKKKLILRRKNAKRIRANACIWFDQIQKFCDALVSCRRTRENMTHERSARQLCIHDTYTMHTSPIQVSIY